MNRRPRLALLLVLACALPGIARAQAILRPNQFAGSVRWSNVNPGIRSFIERPINDATTISARTLAPPSLSATTYAGAPSGREIDRYELTVETSPSGIAYEVAASSAEYGWSAYKFAPIRPPPIASEPSPDVPADFLECAGLLRFRLPVGVVGGTIHAWRDGEGTFGFSLSAQADTKIEAGETAPELLVRGDGHLYHVRVRFELGTDAFADKLTYERLIDVEVHCDEIVEGALLDCTGAGADPASLGRVTGLFDVEGELEVADAGSTRVSDMSAVELDDGPWGNFRLDSLMGDPASGAFDLPRVMPSGVVAPPRAYTLDIRAYLRGGPELQEIRTPRLSVLVPAGATIDTGDAFRIRPGYVEGDIQLAGPPPRGVFGSILQHVMLSGTGPPPTVPANGVVASRVEATGTGAIVAGATHSTFGGSVKSAFVGAFDLVSSEFLGTSQTVLPALAGEPGIWAVGRMYLSMQGSPYDAESHISSRVSIRDHAGDAVEVGPFEHVPLDRRYCMSEVNVAFIATSGTFCDPTITLTGEPNGFTGIDFTGRNVSYDAWLTARGIPRFRSEAASTGTTRLALPAGNYMLAPTFDAISPDGSMSTASVAPIPLTVGCRQIINLTPELGITIGVDDVPPCAEAGLVRVTGSVRSDDPVQSVTYSVSGAAPVTICTACGVSPAFEADVQLADSSNEVVIEATDAVGRRASVTAYSRWAPEPSALDRRPASPPLRVARTPSGDLRLTWEPGREANAYRGTIASLQRGAYDHAGFGACGITDATLSVPAGTGDFYYLAGGACEWGDGSLGRDSSGRQRPPARERCP